MMRHLASILMLVCLVLPSPAVAGNGNGKGQQSQSDGNGNGNANGNGNGNANGNGNGNANGGDNGNAHGHGERGDDSGSASGSGSEVTTILSPEGAAAASDQNLALEAVQNGDALPLSEIVKRVRHLFAARVLDARVIARGPELVYRLTILTDQGVSRKVDIDAKAGVAIGVN